MFKPMLCNGRCKRTASAFWKRPWKGQRQSWKTLPLCENQQPPVLRLHSLQFMYPLCQSSLDEMSKLDEVTVEKYRILRRLDRKIFKGKVFKADNRRQLVAISQRIC